MLLAKEKESPILEKDPMVCPDACKKGLGKVPNRAIGQIKVQRKHCSPEEATWKLKDAMRLAHPFCSILQSIEVVPV